MDQLVKTTHDDLEAEYPGYNREEMHDIARMYVDAVDKEGFIFDFDNAWPIAGYSTKGSAKRVLLRDLEENRDYTVEKVDLTSMLNQNSMGENGGDRKTEKNHAQCSGPEPFRSGG